MRAPHRRVLVEDIAVAPTVSGASPEPTVAGRIDAIPEVSRDTHTCWRKFALIERSASICTLMLWPASRSAFSTAAVRAFLRSRSAHSMVAFAFFASTVPVFWRPSASANSMSY